MKSAALLCLMLLSFAARKQNSPRPVPALVEPGDLEAVLTQMDKASTSFRTAHAEFEWDNYQKVVDETEKQSGQVYFRRSGNRENDVEAMFDVTGPEAKQVLFKGGKLMLYSPKIDQITEYELGKNKSAVDAFLNLGFGARGHDLLHSYDVKMAGWETVDGAKTAKLELTALAPKVRNMFSQFVLWIDPRRDIPIKQEVIEPSGDYWRSHYTEFKLGDKIPDDAFQIKKTPHTKVVRPQ